MTFEEAKKILKKEGFYVEKATRPCAISESFIEYEDPTICEAIQVVSSAGYFVCMEMSCFDERKARLKKELEEHSNAPVSGKEKAKEGNPALKEAASQFNDALLDEQAKKIGEQNKEITRLLSLVEKKENSISRLYYEKSVLEKKNEDLKKGEIPARYFDKALVDEQEEKIKKLEHEKLDILEMASSCKQTIAEQGKKINRLGKEIARLNGIIHDKNEEIKRKTKGCCELVAENVDLKEDLRNTESLLHDTREANSRNLDTCFKNEDLIDELKKKLAEKTKLAKKYAKELSDSSLGLCKLEKQLKDKNAVLSDVAEELRLTKIREKNLAELGLKYVGENEKLKKELADKVVDKIDAQALKSAESALAWKEKVIAEKDMALAYNEKEIADLQEKLKSIYKNRHIERVYKKKLVEKDEVIDNLHKELKAQKGLVNHISKKYDGAKINLNLRMKECEKLKEALDEANKHQQQAYRSCTDKNNEIRALKLQISALEKRGNGIDWKHNADAIKLYVNRASHERLWNSISQDICNEKELSFIINHGGKRVKYALHFDGTDIVYECSDPDKKNNDLMVGADIAEEGGDNSGVIVLSGKDFIDAIKKMK